MAYCKLCCCDSNGIRTHNCLVRKRTFNHLTKLAKWLSYVVKTYLYAAFDCMLLSCHIRVSKQVCTFSKNIFRFLWFAKTCFWSSGCFKGFCEGGVQCSFSITFLGNCLLFWFWGFYITLIQGGSHGKISVWCRF